MPIRVPHYNKVVIDTAPLLSALTLELLEREPQAASILHKHPLQPYLASDPTSRRNFRALLGNIGEILITSHVVDEIKSRFHITENLRAGYWESSLSFFVKHNINEKLVTVAELNQDEKLRQIVCKIGPTDVGLMFLARREECILLTDDRGLYSWLGAFQGLRIELVENLVSVD